MEAKKTLILRIYQILNDYSSAEKPLKQTDILAILQRDYDIVCERKAVGRNISMLKECGFDIYSDKRGSYLETREFESSELRLLIDSVLSSRYITSSHSQALIEKLVKAGGKDFKSRVKHIYSVKEWNKSDNSAFFYNIDLVDEAIESGKKLKFWYNKYGIDKKLHHTKLHTVSPYQLFLKNQRYYLMGESDQWDSIAFFRLDKITDIEISKEISKPLRENEGYKNGIDYSKFSTAFPYMYADKPERIELKCKNDTIVIDALVDWFGDDCTIDKLNDEYVIATVTASPTAMAYWSLQYGNSVEVLAPASLRAKVAQTVFELAEKYK